MLAVEFIPATPDLVRAVARNLRQADLDEIQAVHGREVDPALLMAMSVKLSDEPVVAMARGEPIAVLGCAPAGTMLTRFGSPWLLGTPASAEHPRVFVAAGRRFTQRWRQQHGLLLNRVDARNAASIRWLRCLGFEIHKAVPYGALGLPFHPFTMGA